MSPRSCSVQLLSAITHTALNKLLHLLMPVHHQVWGSNPYDYIWTSLLTGCVLGFRRLIRQRQC